MAAGGESETVEFKATTGQRSKAARTLSAMLNGRGGRVLFGVQSNGNVTGQQASDKTLEKITQVCEEDIRPRHPPSVERIPLPGSNGREVLVVEVPKGTRKPYSCKGRHYMRSGASTVDMPADRQVSMMLERHHSLDRWELETSHRGLDAIDYEEVRAFRDDAISARRAGFDAAAAVVDVLRAMSLLDNQDRPNRAAVALFGRSESFVGQYPTLGCRLVAAAQTELREEFIDDVLVQGNAFTSLRRAAAFCEEHLHHPVRIRGGLQAETGLEIPIEVVREALANAFAHRDYAVGGLVQVRVMRDRLEVRSPGGLHFGLTPADLYEPHSSHPWNPAMLGCLYRRGFVEQLGSGTLRMAALCREAGLGRPSFTASSASVACIVPRRGYWLSPDGASIAVSGEEAVVLSTLAQGPSGRSRIADHAGISPSKARSILVRLQQSGLARVKGVGRGSLWSLSNGEPCHD